MKKTWLCDPKKNKNCPKDLCQKDCTLTTEIQFAKVLYDIETGDRLVVKCDLDSWDVSTEKI